jgi:hypothetical protein
VLDSGRTTRARRACAIKKIGPEPYGTISQILDGTRYAGKTVRLSGWIRTDAVPEGRNTGAGSCCWQCAAARSSRTSS